MSKVEVIKLKGCSVDNFDNVEIDKNRLVDGVSECGELAIGEESVAWRRHGGILEGKSFLLSDVYDWVMGVDNEGRVVLVPLLKEVVEK